MLRTEFVPAAEKNSRQLLVALHGLGDSSAGYRWMPGEMALPGVNYLLVNAPDDYFGGYSWFDFMGDAAPGIERSRRIIFELLDAQRAKGFPTEQTVLFGFSQGCLMTVDVGFRYPHVFAGLVGISGWVQEPEQLMKERSEVADRQRMLFTHGTLDPLVPFAKARGQVEQLKAAGLQIEWLEFQKPHTIAGEAELGVIRQFVAARLGQT